MELVALCGNRVVVDIEVSKRSGLLRTVLEMDASTSTVNVSVERNTLLRIVEYMERTSECNEYTYNHRTLPRTSDLRVLIKSSDDLNWVCALTDTELVCTANAAHYMDIPRLVGLTVLTINARRLEQPPIDTMIRFKGLLPFPYTFEQVQDMVIEWIE